MESLNRKNAKHDKQNHHHELPNHKGRLQTVSEPLLSGLVWKPPPELTQNCTQILELAILEFQWIEIRCTVKVINVFDSFEPQRYFKCYWQ